MSNLLERIKKALKVKKHLKIKRKFMENGTIAEVVDYKDGNVYLRTIGSSKSFPFTANYVSRMYEEA